MYSRLLAATVLFVSVMALGESQEGNPAAVSQSAPVAAAAAPKPTAPSAKSVAAPTPAPKVAPAPLPAAPPEPPPVLPEDPTGPVTVTLPDAAKLSASPGYFLLTAKVNIGQKQFPMSFAIFLPQAYFSSNQRFPLVIALHNRGLEGSGAGALECEGITTLWAHNTFDARDKHHAPTTQAVDLRKPGVYIGLAPQAPRGRAMNVSPMPQVLAAAMDAFAAAYRVDNDRTYLTGFSYGASQVWLIGEQMPQRFAALVPYAGRATPDPAKTAGTLARMPVYIGSGEIDTFFSSQCDTMYKELLAAGGSDVVRRQIPAGNHFSYSVIYTDPQFLDWLLSKRISQRPATRPATTQPVQ